MNQVAKHQRDYECIDAGSGEKLERWRDIILRHPDPQVIWSMEESSMWNPPHARHHYLESGGGSWEYKKKFRDSWTVSYSDLRFKVSPTGFKYTGLFPEQAADWDWMMDMIQDNEREDLRMLNLFAYTGGAIMARVNTGAAEVVHVDASKGMVNWVKENMMLSHLGNRKIRFIMDDVLKFVVRGKRRGRTYHVITMNPPSYGRGSNGEIWRIEEQLYPLTSACMGILDENPLLSPANSYTTRFPPTVLYNLLRTTVSKKHRDGQIDAGEIGLPITVTNSVLSCGIYGKWVSSRR